MGWLSSALDWCADKVQTVTGEKERRVLVEQFKEMYDDFKPKLPINYTHNLV